MVEGELSLPFPLFLVPVTHSILKQEAELERLWASPCFL